MAIGSITRFVKSALARAAQVTSRGSDPAIQHDAERRATPRTALGPAIPVEDLEASSHHQLQSTLFGKLPLEIRRQIYQELWLSSGLSQHVFERRGRLQHCPCIIDHDEPDERDDLVEMYRLEKEITDSDSFKHRALHRKLASPWTKHWKCEENLSQNGAPPNPFLLSLLSCKRMHLEAMDSMSEHLTFNFTSFDAAYDFVVLGRNAPIANRVRSLNFSFYLTRQEINQFMSWGETRWSQFWASLAQLSELQDVKLWLDGRLGQDQHELQVHGPALFRCFGAGPSFNLTINLPTDEETEDKLDDPWGPRYAMDCLRDVNLEFRGLPTYRPCAGDCVLSAPSNGVPTLEIMAWYGLGMNM
jgi:hypothetical protein